MIEELSQTLRAAVQSLQSIREDRSEQGNALIKKLEQDNKSLKGELDDTREQLLAQARLAGTREDRVLSNDRLSDTDASWIQVSGCDATDCSSDACASWVSVNTLDSPCWLQDALFKKVTNGEESFVQACKLAQGSIVLDADGEMIRVADPPTLHAANSIVVLHAADGILPVTPKHRVPILTGDDRHEKFAEDLQVGDLIFVSGNPSPLTKKVVRPGDWTVVQIRFVPDKLVPVFMASPSIDTLGHRLKKTRRGMRRHNNASSSAELRTEGEYMD